MATHNSINAPTTAGTVVSGNGTGFSALAYSSTGGTGNLVSRDSNSNSSINNQILGYTSTVLPGIAFFLTAADTELQFFTGSADSTIRLPDNTTLILGQSYKLVNLSSASVTVWSFDDSIITVMAPNTTLTATVNNIVAQDNTTWNI